MASTELPKLPVRHDELPSYISKNPGTSIEQLMAPFRKYEAQLREIYAQDRNNPLLDDHYLNVLPVFTDNTPDIKSRARNLNAETEDEKSKYIMPLPDDKRRPTGSPAVVQSLKEFRHNFAVFSESSLIDMNWDNVVAAGSSVVNCLLPVPNQFKTSKRALRQYFHEKFCPASDVDLFLYGLTEQQAIDKIKEIETRIRDSILTEVTVVRTKNAITICSQYPTRHVQIVLRVYKSVSEILTGFDIDCSGAAYDGKQVYCTPRALTSYITQINPIDMSRRSPSYENRLSKYSHRNFEIYWSELDRSRVDPTIFERSFGRTLGLARLLVLERLPTYSARENYLQKRREERGRPDVGYRFQFKMHGNIKDEYEDEVADWVNEDEVSNYHTFSVPYGERFNAKKIEKLCYTRDLLLNAEWNQPDEREVYLHRHPAFFGRVEDVIGDCCGTCPKPVTEEEVEIAEKESEIYVSGNVSFRIDDPGRQQIGSFNPLTADDWTEMAYVGNVARLCQAIVDEDLEHVQDWVSQDGANPNTRDYTGRTPLQLAVMCSTPAIVKCLVDHGARLIARIADGRTALHLAAARGSTKIVKILLDKSAENEEAEDEKQELRRKARMAAAKEKEAGDSDEMDVDSDDEIIDSDLSDDERPKSTTTGSFVKVDNEEENKNKEEVIPLDDNEDDPDVYKVDVVAWDTHSSAVHLAILGGHCDVVKLLCEEYAADVLLPVKISDSYGRNSALLTLVLALALPVDKAVEMSKLLLSLGATSSQADMSSVTAFHRYVHHGVTKLIDTLWNNDKLGLKTAINHVAVSGSSWHTSATTPLMNAIDKCDPILVLRLLDAGANPEIDFDTWLKSAKHSSDLRLPNFESNQKMFKRSVEQPLMIAIKSAQPSTAISLLERGADPNVITKSSQELIEDEYRRRYTKGESALDVVRECISKILERVKPTEDKNGYFNPDSFTFDEPPKAPEETAEFLSQFEDGTYQHWMVSSDVESKMEYYKSRLEDFEESQERNKNRKGIKEKEDAIRDLLSQLEQVEKAMLDRGAKTFKELHPDIQDPDNQPNYYRSSNSNDSKGYSFKFDFYHSRDLTDARKQAYITLFEAAWAGDIEKIRSLTLASWGESKEEPPLKIAVEDTSNNNPFSLAFLKGHYDTAKAVLEIVQAQWSPMDKKKSRFRMPSEDDEDDYDMSDAESDDSAPNIHEEIVNDQYTIDNIGQVSMQVKSNTLPTAVLDWSAPTFKHPTSREDLLCRTIKDNNKQGFKFLVDMGVLFTSQKPDTEDDSEVEGADRAYIFPKYAFETAIELGRVDMLDEVIKCAGAGLPLEDLVKKSGMEMKVKPRYYQGLTVYGKKRSDWANAGRNLIVKSTGTKVPPLLTAAIEGSLPSVEWFLSDTPKRRYLEFGESKQAKADARLKHLRQSPGGFDGAITKWLGMQNDLVIHCAVMGPINDDTHRLIEYLIKAYPSSLETKSDLGYTPLYLACMFGRVDFARTLIKAGADQSVVDKDCENIIHAALRKSPCVDRLRELLEMLDPELRSHLFLQRTLLTAGGNTPLHFWLKDATSSWMYTRSTSGGENEYITDLLKLILEFSGGHDLEILNGTGDTCLHTAVLRQFPQLMKVMLDCNPKLLYRENAVGRTPAEIAYDCYISTKVSRPPGIDVNSYNAYDPFNFSPESFIKKNEATDRAPSKGELVWKVAQDYLERLPEKRRLVSLNEANDVARRLGENYSWQRYYQKRVTIDDDDDEGQQNQQEQKESDFVTEQAGLSRKTWPCGKCARCKAL